MELGDICDFIYKLWVEDFGAMADRSKVRKALDMELDNATMIFLEAGMDTSRSDEILARAQKDLMAMQGPAQKRPRPELVPDSDPIPVTEQPDEGAMS